MQNNQNSLNYQQIDINTRLKRKPVIKQQKKRSQLRNETIIIDANEKTKRNDHGELIITYEKLQDDIVFDIDLCSLHTYGAKNMVLIERSPTPTQN